MENLPLIKFAELNKGIIIRDSFQDIFLIADINGGRSMDDPDRHDHTLPMRLDALLMVLVLEGSSEIALDYVPYKIEKNNFTIIMPTHTIQLNKISDDFKGKLLVISRDFINECNTAKRSPSMANYMQLKKNPCTIFDEKEAELVDDYIELLRRKINNRAHFFQKEVMQNAFVGFLLEIANIMMGKKDGMLVPALSRKEELFEQFLQLLFKHCKEQHVVTFYADKLFITPQYLSLILKELTGKSANKWIDDALIVEAKILLKAPQATVQQVADILHFSDQSTFGKFFKKHMGISPMEYRKS